MIGQYPSKDMGATVLFRLIGIVLYKAFRMVSLPIMLS